MSPEYQELLRVLVKSYPVLSYDERKQIKDIVDAMFDALPVPRPPDTDKKPETKKGKRKMPIRILLPGVKARYLENGQIQHTENTPNALAKAVRIRPAKFVLSGHPWDGVTYGVTGYRTILHAFTANGYEVDIGDGWGKYQKEYTKPYARFDARKAIGK